MARGDRVITMAPDDEFTHRLMSIGCEHRTIPMDPRGTKPWMEARTLLSIRRQIRDLSPHAILSFTIKNNLYSGCSTFGLKTKFLPNVSGLGSAFQSGSFASKLAIIAHKFAFRKAPVALFQNEEDREQFVRSGVLPKDRTQVLPGSGVDLQRFRPNSETSTAPGQKVFLMSCRLLWRKGVREFVEAAHAVKLDWPRARFLLLGFPSDDERLGPTKFEVEAWHRAGNIEYLPPVDDVESVLRKVDVCVLPSNYAEGTPKSLLEALAMGIPIITTDKPGCRRVVENGKNGYLCRPTDADDLQAKMVALLSLSPTEFQHFRQHSRALAERRFDEKFVIDYYLSATE